MPLLILTKYFYTKYNVVFKFHPVHNKLYGKTTFLNLSRYIYKILLDMGTGSGLITMKQYPSELDDRELYIRLSFNHINLDKIYNITCLYRFSKKHTKSLLKTLRSQILKQTGIKLNDSNILYINVLSIVVEKPTEDEMVWGLPWWYAGMVEYFYNPRAGKKRVAVVQKQYTSNHHNLYYEEILFWVSDYYTKF